MKSRSKNITKSMPEKGMQKIWKMMPKWRPNGGQNRLKIWKSAKKSMPKFNAEFWCWFLDYGGDFGSIFGAVWGVWGVAEFKLRLQADFFPSFHTPCTPGGVRRIKNQCKFDARKRVAKIMKNVPKCIQNGSQNQHKSLKKRGSKMCWFLGSIFGDP